MKHDLHAKPGTPDNNSINTEAMASATHSQIYSNSRGSWAAGNVKQQQKQQK